MGNLVDNKFTWVIKDSIFISNKISSNKFVVGGCKWKLTIKFWDGCLSLYLSVAKYKSLPCGWSIHTKVSFTVVNQLSEKLSVKKEKYYWFDEQWTSCGFSEMICLTKLYEEDSGFLVNDELKITVEIDVLEAIGILDESDETEEDESEEYEEDVSEESEEETSQPLKKRKQDNDGDLSSDLLNKAQQLKEVNGFLVLPSQEESVKRIFEKHPNIAIDFKAKNQNLRTACINVLLNLIDTLCMSLQDLTIDDLGTSDSSLTYLKSLRFKVDWLEGKLEEVKGKKMEAGMSETRVKELEEELKDIDPLIEKKKEELYDLKQKRSVTEALLKREKAKVLAIRVPPLMLDDVV